ncbi:MAG: excisionase family DNA-binding protein [Ktedonobacterales bacterium]|nr:excisionase family DNA-binding protein [Ktedonobacterales bacterium]
MEAYLSTHQIATRLGVHEETIRRWLRAGELRGVSLGRAGYRVSETDLHAFLAHRLGDAPAAPAPPTLTEAALQALLAKTRHDAETERTQLRAALQREQDARAVAEAATQQTKAMFEAITDGIFIIDTQGGIPLINHAARRLLLVPDEAPAEYPAIPPFELFDTAGEPIPRERWPQVQLFAGATMQPGDALDMLLRTRDGQVRQINITGAPLPDSAGNITDVVVVCRDVTERRQLEQRTRASLAALLTMAEEMTCLPGTTEADRAEGELAQHLIELMRQVLGCQRASLTVIDPTTGALRSAAVAGITPQEEREWRDRRPGAVLSEYLRHPLLAEKLLADGAAVLDLTQPSWNAAPAPYGIHTLLLVSLQIAERHVGILALDYGGTSHDFTSDEITLAKAVGKLAALVLERERLLRDRAVAMAKEEALRTANQRMDEFLSIASHELRTPMTTIKISLQLLSRRAERLASIVATAAPDQAVSMADIRHLIERAEGQADRQTRLMSDLLDATRIQSGKMAYRFAPCDLLTLLHEAITEAGNLDPRRRLTFTGESIPCMITADADRVSQVIMNYLTNALKYSDLHDPVVVCLERVGTMARVSVADRGRGLTHEDQAHIWERFYRVAEGQEEGTTIDGLGLGLFICRTIIAAHGGEVGVTSATGHGATFWFTLPLASASVSSSAAS